MRRLTPRTITVRLLVFCGLVMVGCGKGCDGSSSPPPHMQQQPVQTQSSGGCSLDFSKPEPVVACPATLDDVPDLCSDPDLVCNYEQTDTSRVRCACEGGRWSCIDTDADLGVKMDDLAGPATPSDDLGEED